MPNRTMDTGPDLMAAQRVALQASVDKARAEEPEVRLYALLDVGQHPDLHLFAEALESPQVSLFDGTPEAAAQVFSPRLISLDSPAGTEAAGLQDRLLATALQRPCVAWLLSPLPLPALGEHLRGWLGGMLLDADGSELGEVMARFFDPRVLPGFMAMLSAGQKAALLRPIQLWATWLRARQWQEWHRPSDPVAALLPNKPQFTFEQATQLDAATRTDRLLARLEDQCAEPTSAELAEDLEQRLFALPHDLRHQRLDRMVQRAVEAGLRRDADILLYCTLALSVCERFDEHPSVRAALASCATNDAGLSVAIASVAPDEWQAIESRSSWRRAASANPQNF
jgi:hypothetical protein